MVKDSLPKPKTKPPTPFQKFDALVKKIVRVPKREIQGQRKSR